MVFENVTALELHLHTSEEAPLPPVSRPDRSADRSSKKETSTRRVSPKTMAIAMLVVSISLSIVVTLVVRRFRSNGDDEGAE
ncbi:hypothetical protein HSRCO_1430 [Halanaeroarchaeum sp. HSR-CO]|uniref:hypothetical protein n=1 Tax=Halanaeroarchaeum sp. HSR-CO TaxID=2866382 RepID=UPI00217F1830|nr:hypothetical protein [Halanaeroarchaeum sp. HSR-CO]UWG47712.1 hypothetical protein HSRCO_1430 [Halanaeroarchaeum sp. HSR-CO]